MKDTVAMGTATYFAGFQRPVCIFTDSKFCKTFRFWIIMGSVLFHRRASTHKYCDSYLRRNSWNGLQARVLPQPTTRWQCSSITEPQFQFSKESWNKLSKANVTVWTRRLLETRKRKSLSPVLLRYILHTCILDCLVFRTLILKIKTSHFLLQ